MVSAMHWERSILILIVSVCVWFVCACGSNTSDQTEKLEAASSDPSAGRLQPPSENAANQDGSPTTASPTNNILYSTQSAAPELEARKVESESAANGEDADGSIETATDEDETPAAPPLDEQPRRGIFDRAIHPLPPITAPPGHEPFSNQSEPIPPAQTTNNSGALNGDGHGRETNPLDPKISAELDAWSVPLGTFRSYLQNIQNPQPPEIGAARDITVTSMEAMQAAIASNTIINVSGVLNATNENLVRIANVQNVVIRFEPNAEIRFGGSQTWSGVFQIAPSVRGLTIDSPRISGPVGTQATCAGIEFLHDDDPAVCQDITITNGIFRGLNYAIQGHGGCRRMLIQNCKASDLIDYFYFGAKNVQDLTISGCSVHGIKGNHAIRIFDANGVNIFRNDLKVDSIQDGQMKRTIWILTGDHVTIAANKTRDGRVTIGPNPVAHDSSPQDRVGNVNVVFNRIHHTHTNTPIEVLSGAHDIFLTGNVVTTFDDTWLGIGGWNEHRRPINKVHWTDGTIYNGNEVKLWEGVALNENYKGQVDIGPVTVVP